MMLLKRSLYLALVLLMSACTNQATETETETVDTEAPVEIQETSTPPPYRNMERTRILNQKNIKPLHLKKK